VLRLNRPRRTLYRYQDCVLCWMEMTTAGVGTADNSLALAVNGKRCGECQCVNMNDGQMNIVAIARQGGGL
jgi:hypothetical protein